MKQKTLFKAAALLLVLAMCLSVSAFAAEWPTSFTDVGESDYYYPAVEWGLEDRITNGVGGGLFDPQGSVTRAQAVTFLWRMAGCPEPTNTETFSDVEAGSWYETAVMWAVEQGVTIGTGNNKFSPNLTLSRAMCLTMLYRMEGSPLDAAAAAEPVEMTEDITLEELGIYMLQQIIEVFRDNSVIPDVAEGAYYELAVIWGAMSEIITEDNTGDLEIGVTFRPDEPCTRAEMISFMYQTMLLEERANAPELIDCGTITVAIPQAYSDLVYRIMYSVSDDEEGMLITISERASREAAEAMGLDPDEYGAGELFRIERVTEATLEELRSGDMSGMTVFAVDDNGMYYMFVTPTDVRYMRETNEQMEADVAQWTELNEWARSSVISDILKYSEDLTPVD